MNAFHTGPNPTDRGEPGTKRHVLVDANGIRYERRADIHLAFTTLAAALIAWRFVERRFCWALSARALWVSRKRTPFAFGLGPNSESAPRDRA